ncbi:MAG: rRNA adenine N-6-methyltransferase family protein [Hyphomicrobiales bacterium]
MLDDILPVKGSVRAFKKLKSKPASVVRRVRQDTRFIKNWFDNPLKMGAIAPSGSELANTMASFVPLDSDLPILEIGPGTGAVTKALLDHGVKPEKLVAIEYSADFCTLLRDEFPDIDVINGDGFNVQKTLSKHFNTPPRFAAVVSSLPLLNSPKDKREVLLDEILELLDGNPFIQFSYGLRAPVAAPRGVSVEKTSWIARNIPPARVFVYRKQSRTI